MSKIKDGARLRAVFFNDKICDMKRILIVDDSRAWVNHHAYNLKEIFKEEIELTYSYSAKEADQAITANLDTPFDIILTDMQMETDFLPLYAGEWFIKQVQSYPEYNDTKIYIISAASNIKQIAEKYKVDFIPKRDCQYMDSYKIIV